MRRWLISVVALAAGCGVANEDSASTPGDDGVIDCTDGSVRAAGRCVAPPGENPCVFAADNADICVDADQDCFVANCEGLTTAFIAAVLDCDDRRPDVNPDQEERCDEADDDCDGRTDEAFDVGDACEACGRAGKTECARDGGEVLACSTAAGQSRAPDDAELCNDKDDDCDGRIDEGCALAQGEISAPTLCVGGIAYAVETGIRWQPDDGPADDLGEAGATAPTCSSTHIAWLAVPPEGECLGGDDVPPRCNLASLMLHSLGGETVDLTGPSALGRPLIAGDSLYWHALVGDTPTLRSRALAGGSIESLGGALPLTDPTAPTGDTLIARRWSGPEPEVVVLNNGAVRVLPQPRAAAGAPSADEDWIVWPMGTPPDSLWAAPRSDPDASFQLTEGGGPHQNPQVAAGRIVWVEGNTLQTFVIETGERSTLATSVVPTAFAADSTRVVWVGQGEGPALFQWVWP